MYEDGIARVTIEEPESGRFRISEQPILTEGISIKPVSMIEDFFSYTDVGFNIEGTTSGDESFRYVITASPFEISQ